MLSFFTDPYEDEILYSTIARYHYYYGNVDYKDTLHEIFGSRNIIPTIEFPSKLEYLAKQFQEKKRYSSDYLISNHTLLPYYSPFIPLARRLVIEKEMKYGDGKGLFTQIGVAAGSVCRKSDLYYCPECVTDDIEKNKEPYFHRMHQLQGIQLCYKHNCILKIYPITRKNQSRISFIMFDYNKINTIPEFFNYEKAGDFHSMLAKSAFYLLNNDLGLLNQRIVYEKYRNMLVNKGLMTYNGTIKQKELFDEFINFYGINFLEQVHSNIEFENMSNWLRMITQKPKKVFHPIRHILFINFLTESIEMFFEKESELKRPFGMGLWPCLNPVAKHFKENVITDCVITPDFKTRKPVGTFTCSCGFIYSRKGLDTEESDRYKFGRVKQFGLIWESRLKELLFSCKHSLREIGRLMGCDPKTIVKYADKLELNHFLNSSMTFRKDSRKSDLSKSIGLNDQYKRDILNYINIMQI